MGNLSSSQLKVATHTHTYNEVGISAGTGLTNNEGVFAVDTTTIATKADIADLGSFTVVDTLPSVATADTKTIYLLGPIGTGADKYEEWIVTEENGLISDSEITALPCSVLGPNVNIDGSYNGYVCIIVSPSSAVETYGEPSNFVSYNDNTIHCSNRTMSYNSFEFQSVLSSASCYKSSSPISWGATKQWTKIGETSVDLSGYATTTALTNGLATKQDTLTASDGIDIDGSNNISVDVTDIIGTGLSEDASNNIIVDTTVVATQTDLSGKQDKATSGSTAPSTTPSYVGQQYIDTTADKMYVATGTSSSSDWTEVGSGGGGGGSGDMQYSDFNWVTKTGASITLDLNSYIEPSADFTVNAPATIKDGQVYVLRVATGLVPYTMTLGTNITNPYSEDITLTTNTLSNFSFVATGGNLELQPSIDITGVVTGSYAAAENGTDLSLVTTGEKYTWGDKESKPTSGSGAPSIIPTYVGQRYFRTSNSTWYVANGTTSSSDWAVVDTNTTYTAGDGIDITNNEISVDVTDIISTGLSEDANNNIIVDTTVIQPKLTAGNGIDITNDVISADLAAGTGINISNQTCTTESDRKGPCPSGFHVPSHQELSDVSTLYYNMYQGGIISSPNIMRDLKAPNIGTRAGDAPSPMIHNNGDAYWWTSEPNSTNAEYGLLGRDAPQIRIENRFRAEGMQIRPFMNTTVEPTSSWTVIQGTLGSVGIFWNQTDGLISIGQWSSNVRSGVTMADKNLGATTVWNYGDTATDANSGKFYQWGNNYGFVGVSDTSGETITTTTTQVDASSYGPGNYYSNDEFYVGMYGDYDWSSVQNDDLWGDTSNSTHQECTTTTTLTISSSIDLSGKQDKATTGGVPPSTAPSYVGQQYVDTTTIVPYISTGTTSADWQALPILSKQTGTLPNIKIWVGTQSAYEALAPYYDGNTLYFTTSSS